VLAVAIERALVVETGARVCCWRRFVKRFQGAISEIDDASPLSLCTQRNALSEKEVDSL